MTENKRKLLEQMKLALEIENNKIEDAKKELDSSKNWKRNVDQHPIMGYVVNGGAADEDVKKSEFRLKELEYFNSWKKEMVNFYGKEVK